MRITSLKLKLLATLFQFGHVLWQEMPLFLLFFLNFGYTFVIHFTYMLYCHPQHTIHNPWRMRQANLHTHMETQEYGKYRKFPERGRTLHWISIWMRICIARTRKRVVQGNQRVSIYTNIVFQTQID